MIDIIRKLLELVYRRLSDWLAGTSTGTLQITGVLGLAFLVVGYLQVRGNNDNRRQQPRPSRIRERGRRREDSGAPSSSGHSSRAQLQDGRAAARHAEAPAKPAPPAAHASIYPQLTGVSRLTISTPGVLFQELSASDLQAGATLRPEASQLLRNLAKSTDVYLITHVLDDVGQAVVLGCLESAGLLGHGPGQVKPHKALFCSSLDGKTSMARQIEPELHIDGDARTVEALARFLPQLLHVLPPGSAASVKAANVGSTPSLQAFLS